MAKGPRQDEISFLVSPGDTFKIYVDKNRWREMTRSGEASDHLLPSDGEIAVIPAFSLLEMTIASKNSDAATDKGSCVNIMRVRPLPRDVSVNSISSFLPRLPSSLNDALLGASTKAIASPWIGHDLVKDAVSFFRVTCAVDTVCEIVDLTDKSGVVSQAVRLSHWSTIPSENINPVDVPESAFLASCNAKRLDHAVAMFQVAFAMEAVSLFVTHDAYLAKNGASCLRALPIISCAKMFAKMKMSNFLLDSHLGSAPNLDSLDSLAASSSAPSIQVDSGVTYNDGEGVEMQPIIFSLPLDPTIVDDVDAIELRPSLDFPFMLGYKSSKFYTVSATFGEKPPKERVEGVLVFNVDVSKKSASSSVTRSGSVTVKRKMNRMSFT